MIRFEMPFNVWCGKCNHLIGKGVRFNAEKKAIGGSSWHPASLATLQVTAILIWSVGKMDCAWACIWSYGPQTVLFVRHTNPQRAAAAKGRLPNRRELPLHEGMELQDDDALLPEPHRDPH